MDGRRSKAVIGSKSAGRYFYSVSGPRPRRVRQRRLAGLLGLLLLAGGCATRQSSVETPATSIQTVEYFPFLVKGYEGTFPRKRMLVLPAIDTRPSDERGA